MNQLLRVIAAILIFSATIGCGRKGKVDTGRLESSFKSAEPAAQSEAKNAVAAVKAGNYPEALADLQRLARKAKLTAEQQASVKDAIVQVQKAMTDSANKKSPPAK